MTNTDSIFLNEYGFDYISKNMTTGELDID